MPDDLWAIIRERMPAPARPFIETAEGRLVRYGEIGPLSARLASVLRDRGVRPGDRVAVQVEKSPEAILLFLACLRAGAIYLPLNTAYTEAELDYFVGDAEPALFVAMPERAAEIGRIVARHGAAAVETLGTHGDGSLMERAQALPPVFDDVPAGADDVAAILYTSGTTGRSKGAMLTQRNLASNALTLADLWRFTAEDVLLHALPINHVHGLFVAVNVALVAGASMIFLPKFDLDAVFRQLPRATTMMGVPTFYVRLLQDPRLTKAAVAHVRLFVSGSAPLLAETHRAWAERTGQAILERYGMTETGMNVSNPYEGERIAGTVGLPLPGVELRIADPETGAALGSGAVGVIELRGPNVFKGYWRMPEKTKAEIRPDGFFVTGDLGTVDARGYVRIVGRAKDLVITGGYNVYPKEVEEAIDALPGVAESAVIGLPHPDLGEAVTAVVVPSPGATPAEAAILESVSRQLAGYKRPKRVLLVEALPRNAMGKVQKNVLRAEFAGLYGGALPS